MISCRVTVGEVKGAIFVRLLELLVESVLLYGAEVWGCEGQIGPDEKVQMPAARILAFGSGEAPSNSLPTLNLKWTCCH